MTRRVEWTEEVAEGVSASTIDEEGIMVVLPGGSHDLRLSSPGVSTRAEVSRRRLPIRRVTGLGAELGSKTVSFK